METWIKFQTGGTYEPRLISKGPDGSGYELLTLDTGTFRQIEFRIGPGEPISSTTLEADNWYHIAATYSGSEMCLYFDGVLDVSQPANGPINTSDLNLFLGQKSTGAWDKYKGLMDEVRI